MRPHDGPTSNDLEFEISPCNLFQDIGSIIIEGRLPELSSAGRKCGSHSWPVTNQIKKKCCYQHTDNELCQLVSSVRSKISQLFVENKNVKLEMYCSIKDFSSELLQNEKLRIKVNKCCMTKTILLEQWEIKVTDKKGLTEYVNINMMLQALRSYLHFSQLSSWWNGSQGLFPAFVFYRLSSEYSDKEFLLPSREHKFPSTQISNKETVEILMRSIPRLDKLELIELLKKNFNIYDGGGSDDIIKHINRETMLKKLNYISDSKTIQEIDSCGTKRKVYEIDKYFSNHFKSTNCQTNNYVGEKLMKFTNETKTSRELNTLNPFTKAKEKIDTYLNNLNNGGLCSSSKNTSEICSTTSSLQSLKQNSEFLSQPNIATAKGTVMYMKQDSVETKSGLSDLLQEFSIARSESSHNELNSCKYCLETFKETKCKCDAFDNDKITPPRVSSSTLKTPAVRVSSSTLKTPAVRVRSKSTSPSFGQRQQQKIYGKPSLICTKPIAARRLALVAGTVPVFHPKTGLPISSSPAPVKKSRGVSHRIQDDNSLSGSGSSSEGLQAVSYALSKSAPASTGLLGNFEESVLQGRMPINGTLEGFRADLGASGSFCPKHVTFPVKVQYFNMSDSNTPSPYLGHIYFSDKKLKHKKYRIPEQGTIQLTIFNPNKTVVKVFIVLYDLREMPPLTKTFVRQKVVSLRKDPVTLEEIPTLHYLVHLSFISSKTCHVYLHTEIRMIFPQQAPDGKLVTMTDGPTDPKYTPIVTMTDGPTDPKYTPISEFKNNEIDTSPSMSYIEI